jgi:plasmid rolling circle replication initiator protein Rep
MLDDYKVKKNRNQIIKTNMEKHLSENGNKRFGDCGNWLDFFADEEVTKTKIYRANFCKNRFCPMCAWRLARRDAMKISILMDYIEAERKKAFIFVTLTAPNVKGEDLKDEIAKYNKAFKRLVERDEITKMNQGYIRKLEVTHNKDRDDYHPHFHCIFAVSKSYFKSRDYVKQGRWLTLWRESMGDDNITQVDVRRVTRGKDANEMAAYAVKDIDYGRSQETFDIFYNALKRRQILTYSGIFSEANKKYKTKGLEHYKAIDETKYMWLILHEWGESGYTEKRRREIDEEAHRFLKGHGADDECM